jgi:uncharacterized protein YjiS (DUF1127 family)
MSSTQTHSPDRVTRQRRLLSEIAGWLVRFLRALAKRWAHAQRRRRDLETLLELDARQLKDIGLRRGDIELIVGEKPGPLLQSLQERRAPI